MDQMVGECLVCLERKPLRLLACGHGWCAECLGQAIDTAVALSIAPVLWY